MITITDEYMRERLSKAKTYTLVVLKKTERRNDPDADAIVREHGKRNMALNAEGLLPIVCPVGGETELAGIGIFTGSFDEVKKIMDDDPGVKAGIFTYEVHPCRGFPGSTLP
jgi:hypothetical protein